MSNETLLNNVRTELRWDPKVDSEAIAVSAKEGTVTLRGTVGSCRAKREAKRAAARVSGVKRVSNELEVRLLNENRRGDSELRGHVLQALMLDCRIPKTVNASVQSGWVTLTGVAEWQYQREEAEFIAANVPGVVDVLDQIHLMSSTPNAEDVANSIAKALERRAELDAKKLSVKASAGIVTIEGTVRSWSERNAALAAAWAAPGVVAVTNHLVVEH
jgi:osmotically-inducible protein OsmY